jgi:hypothetical protein
MVKSNDYRWYTPLMKLYKNKANDTDISYSDWDGEPYVDLDTNKIVYSVNEDTDPKDDPHDEMLPRPIKPVKEK